MYYLLCECVFSTIYYYGLRKKKSAHIPPRKERIDTLNVAFYLSSTSPYLPSHAPQPAWWLCAHVVTTTHFLDFVTGAHGFPAHLRLVRFLHHFGHADAVLWFLLLLLMTQTFARLG